VGAAAAAVAVAAVAAVAVAAVAAVAVAAVKAKTAFPLRLRSFGPHGGIVGRRARAALIPRRYRHLKRATR